MKPRGHKRGCRCVACSPATRKKGQRALRRRTRRGAPRRRNPGDREKVYYAAGGRLPYTDDARTAEKLGWHAMTYKARRAGKVFERTIYIERPELLHLYLDAWNLSAESTHGPRWEYRKNPAKHRGGGSMTYAGWHYGIAPYQQYVYGTSEQPFVWLLFVKQGKKESSIGTYATLEQAAAALAQLSGGI